MSTSSISPVHPSPMPVIVPLRIETAGRSRAIQRVESSALVNTGYRADQQELAVPAGVATRLGLWPKPPSTARQIVIRGAAGRALLWTVPNAIRVRVDVTDRKTSYVVAHLLLTPDQNEVLISDALAEAFNLCILSPKKGIWRFQDDPLNLKRPSLQPQTW